jgi:hypothetical protein
MCGKRGGVFLAKMVGLTAFLLVIRFLASG